MCLANFLKIIMVISAVQITAQASQSTDHAKAPNNKFTLSQRAQEELGYASGFFITEFQASSLFTPQLDVGVKLRLLSGYGPTTVLNFANTTAPGSQPADKPTGIDRPIIQAKQLIYGDYVNGRWYILELGLALFNVSGFTSEYYRYWSERSALHEALVGKYFTSNFEIGATIRSLTGFRQPDNTGLIYPPTVDGSAGIERKFDKIRAAGELKFEQALTETSVAGSFDNNRNKPYGAATRMQLALETGYQVNAQNSVYLRGSQRIFRWPDDDNAALWSTFEEASLGRSIEFRWRKEW